MFWFLAEPNGNTKPYGEADFCIELNAWESRTLDYK